MKREEIADLMAFVVVAEERSFTRAAARLSMEGQLLLNTIDLIIDAAIDGHGLAYLPYDQVERAIKEKKLIRVLDKFTPDLPGYHLYYPHRRHAGSAFSLFIDRLKYKGAV